MRLPNLVLALAATSSLGFALPALAQTAPAPDDAKLPVCSASVTDHCMQRAMHAPGRAAKHHARKGHHGHHGGKHHTK